MHWLWAFHRESILVRRLISQFFWAVAMLAFDLPSFAFTLSSSLEAVCKVCPWTISWMNYKERHFFYSSEYFLSSQATVVPLLASSSSLKATTFRRRLPLVNMRRLFALLDCTRQPWTTQFAFPFIVSRRESHSYLYQNSLRVLDLSTRVVLFSTDRVRPGSAADLPAPTP